MPMTALRSRSSWSGQSPIGPKAAIRCSNEKLHIDLATKPSMVRAMAEHHDDPDRHRRELIQLLILEAGRIMEDTSPLLAMVLPVDASDRTQRIEKFRRDPEKIAALTHCARLLNEDTLP